MAQKTKTPTKAPAAKPQALKKPAVAPKAIQAKPAAVAASAAKVRPVAKSAPAVAPKAAAPAVAHKAKAAPAVKPVAVAAKPAVATKAPLVKTAVAPVKPAVAQKPAAAVPGKKPAPFAAKSGAPITVPPRPATAALAKSGTHKITAPVGAIAATPKAIAEKAAAAHKVMVAAAAAAAAAANKKPVNQRHGFKTNEFIVYPAHGVGKIVGIEEQEIAGMALELFVINFDKEKLTLRVPTGKLASVGMRKLADEPLVKKAMETLKGRARIKRTMWSRRAQEYVAKINSGDLISIAEVVRDLYRSEAQPEQSYSERQLYEDALDRMAREIAAVEKLDERGAVQRITEVLSKSAKGRRMAGRGRGRISGAKPVKDPERPVATPGAFLLAR